MPALGHQVGMFALFHNLSSFHDANAVGALHGAEAVGDDHRASPFHQGVQRGLDFALRGAVQGAGGFVQNEQIGVFQNGPGDGNALALAP